MCMLHAASGRTKHCSNCLTPMSKYACRYKRDQGIVSQLNAPDMHTLDNRACIAAWQVIRPMHTPSEPKEQIL